MGLSVLIQRQCLSADARLLVGSGHACWKFRGAAYFQRQTFLHNSKETIDGFKKAIGKWIDQI
jgi:hypothetical protein